MSNTWSDAERWEWYAAGDKAVAPPARAPHVDDNSAPRLAWEIGWVFAIPLAIAALVSLLLAI